MRMSTKSRDTGLVRVCVHQVHQFMSVCKAYHVFVALGPDGLLDLNPSSVQPRKTSVNPKYSVGNDWTQIIIIIVIDYYTDF
jgi:hypothetical protein